MEIAQTTTLSGTGSGSFCYYKDIFENLYDAKYCVEFEISIYVLWN